MPHKRQGQNDQNQHAGGSVGRVKRSRWNRQHLYLVLDDWDKGFSVHKIDADSFVSCSGSDDDSLVSCSSSDDDADSFVSYSGSDDDDCSSSDDDADSFVSYSGSDDDDDYSGSDGTDQTYSGSDDDHHHHHHQGVVSPRHLPEPPALRLESPNGNDEADTDMAFSAMGTKMFVFMNGRCGLVYDVDTAVLAVGAHAPAKMSPDFGFSVHVGDVLYLLTYRFSDNGQHSLDAMSWAPGASLETKGGSWSWSTLPPPPPTFTARKLVVSHALHPDGHTIFMTTANRETPSAPLGTYSFNTMEATWRWHGECALPFFEQGHFDAQLNAWIGLRLDGYVCSCQAVSVDFLSTRPLKKHFAFIDPNIYLDCKTTKEKLFRKDRKGYMRASLTSMGSGRFCLVECVASKEGQNRLLFGDYDSWVLHMTIFGLKYDDKGELQITDQKSRRSFIVSRHISYFGPFAFWM